MNISGGDMVPVTGTSFVRCCLKILPLRVLTKWKNLCTLNMQFNCLNLTKRWRDTMKKWYAKSKRPGRKQVEVKEHLCAVGELSKEYGR